MKKAIIILLLFTASASARTINDYVYDIAGVVEVFVDYKHRYGKRLLFAKAGASNFTDRGRITMNITFKIGIGIAF